MRSQDSAQTLYCIGDSHVSFFSGKDVMVPMWPEESTPRLPFRAYRLGPVLAYSLGRRASSTRGREKLFTLLITQIPRGSYVLLCFGEIDCRTQVVKKAVEKGLPVEQIAQDLAARYFQVAQEINGLGYHVLIWNIVPATKMALGGDFPTVGDWEERDAATRELNRRLDALCRSGDIRFVSIYDDIVREDGSPDPCYFMDDIHLGQNAMPLAFSVIARTMGWTLS